jgi:hypothetical protein
VDHDPQELVVGPHGNLRITVRMTSPPTARVLDAVETPA